MKLTVDIFDETRQIPEEALAWLLRYAEIAIRRLGGIGEVRIRVVGDQAMAAAHEEFAGVAGTTDVLTFDMVDTEEHPRQMPPRAADIELGNVSSAFVLDTDILICLDEAQRQALRREYPFERELLLYVVHGVLHCLGFDDHNEENYKVMHATEDTLLAAIGVGPVFHRPNEGAA